MIVLNSIEKINIPTIVALGNFDSMHLGHQRLIAGAVQLAREHHYLSVVFTFDQLPANVIAEKTVVKNVLTDEEKFEEINNLGVDVVINAHFDKNMQGMSPKDFAFNVLKETLNCKCAVCGFNYSFGYMGHGNPEILEKLGDEAGFKTLVMDEFKIDGRTVSSSHVRDLLAAGKVNDYLKFTGRRYAIEGKVIEGNHLGTRMGYPTVNLSLNDEMCLPVNGVYVTFIYIEGKRYYGVTNVGNKPTVGTYEKNAETYIFGYSGDELYGKDIKVEFIAFRRPEQKFETIEDLEKQIAKDCQDASMYLKAYGL